MSDDLRTEKVTVNFSPTKKVELEEEARSMGYVAKRGKKSVQLAKYVHDKAISKEGVRIKLDGVDDVLNEYNVLRTTRKMISYFHYLTKTINEDIRSSPALQEKYGDIPYLQEEHLNHIETLCIEVKEMEHKIFKELTKINKQLIRLEEEHGIYF